MKHQLVDIVGRHPATQIIGKQERTITNVARANDENFNENSIGWVSDKNVSLLANIHRGSIICSTAVPKENFLPEVTYVVVDNPRLYFLKMVADFFVEKEPAVISKHAIIHPSAIIGKDVTIQSGVVIEKDCVIGDSTFIDCNTVLKRGTIVGKHVRIGANTTIGGNGFGYEKDASGDFIFIPHIGNVVIEDHVDVGNNTAIDRAVLGSTILRKNSKIDNLVHIAHGVDVGENTLVIAHAMIAGSVVLGKNVWVAPSVSVLNKITVEDNAVLGMGAVVLKPVKQGQTIVGNPGKDLQQLKKS